MWSREAFPEQWASTNHNLGVAYSVRILGDRAENIETAIDKLNQSLSVRPREMFPEDWAKAQNTLGALYSARLRGERADNVEQALAHIEAATVVYTRDAFPENWANVQNNLGQGYWGRVRGNKAANIEKAIAHFEAAATVLRRESFPQQWARIQYNTGTAYVNRIRGDGARNANKAIEHLNASLEVSTRDAYPQLWAGNKGNLCHAYWKRPIDRAASVEMAIESCEAALTVYTETAFPDEWANITVDLANAYRDRVAGEPAGNLAKARAYYEAALRVQTRGAFPRIHLTTARLLGGLHSANGDWRSAATAYASAREAFLVLFGQGLSEAEARDVIAEAGTLFAEAAYAAVQLDNYEASLALASEGRARMLAVALRLNLLDVAGEKAARIGELRAAIRADDRAVETMVGIDRFETLERLGTLRRELAELVASVGVAKGNPDTAASQAASLAGPSGAVLMPIVTRAGAKVLVITQGGNPSENISVVDLPGLTTDRLNLIVRGNAKDGHPGGWLGAYGINYLPPPEQSARWSEWLTAITDLGPPLWLLVCDRLHSTLAARGVKPGARVIWLPTGALGILPIGLAQDPRSQKRFGDLYEVVYAPSIEALAAAQDVIAKAATPTLAAIINPTGDLPGTEKEGAIVAGHFANDARTLLTGAAASPDAVLKALKA